jgi:hypothetical protein
MDLRKVLNSDNFNKFNEQIIKNQEPIFACDPLDFGSCLPSVCDDAEVIGNKRWTALQMAMFDKEEPGSKNKFFRNLDERKNLKKVYKQ